MRRSFKPWLDLKQRIAAAAQDRRCYVAENRAERDILVRHQRLGDLISPFPQQYALPERWIRLYRDEQERHIIRAYAHVHPDAVFCSISAAVMRGLPVSYALLGRLHLYTDPCAPSRSNQYVVRHKEANPQFGVIDGVRVASIMQTAVESLCACTLVDGLPIADGVLRRLGIERELLQACVERLGKGRRGVQSARLTASYADGRAESGGESVARAVMIQGGILPSDLQREYVDPLDPANTYRPDYIFEMKDGTTKVGELDGKGKYVDEQMLAGRSTVDVLIAERQRESRLTLLGMPVVRFTMRDVMTPSRLVAMLGAAGITPQTLGGADYRTALPQRRW